jgi:hypothetical protein
MALIDHFELLTKLLRRIENLRDTQKLFNEHISLQGIYNEGYADGINDALNEIRREL